MNENPYQSPQSNILSGNTYTESSGGISPLVIEEMSKTKGWVRFFSVLLFIGSFFLVVAGIGMSLVMIAGAGAEAGIGVILGVVYFVFAVLYIYPGVKMWKYASSIRRLMDSENITDLESALGQQRRFWQFVGVLAVITMVLYVVFIVAAIAIPGVAAALASV